MAEAANPAKKDLRAFYKVIGLEGGKPFCIQYGTGTRAIITDLSDKQQPNMGSLVFLEKIGEQDGTITAKLKEDYGNDLAWKKRVIGQFGDVPAQEAGKNTDLDSRVRDFPSAVNDLNIWISYTAEKGNIYTDELREVLQFAKDFGFYFKAGGYVRSHEQVSDDFLTLWGAIATATSGWKPNDVSFIDDKLVHICLLIEADKDTRKFEAKTKYGIFDFNEARKEKLRSNSQNTYLSIDRLISGVKKERLVYQSDTNLCEELLTEILSRAPLGFFTTPRDVGKSISEFKKARDAYNSIKRAWEDTAVLEQFDIVEMCLERDLQKEKAEQENIAASVADTVISVNPTIRSMYGAAAEFYTVVSQYAQRFLSLRFSDIRKNIDYFVKYVLEAEPREPLEYAKGALHILWSEFYDTVKSKLNSIDIAIAKRQVDLLEARIEEDYKKATEVGGNTGQREPKKELADYAEEIARVHRTAEQIAAREGEISGSYRQVGRELFLDLRSICTFNKSKQLDRVSAEVHRIATLFHDGFRYTESIPVAKEKLVLALASFYSAAKSAKVDEGIIREIEDGFIKLEACLIRDSKK